jgi:hypothetical protein
VQQNRDIRKKAWQAGLAMRAARDKQDRETIERILGPEAASKGAKVYTYANHSVNFKTMMIQDQKMRLRAIKDTTFTYSKDFVSQNISLGDDPKEKKPSDDKVHWLTPSGFQANKPRTRQELITHPKRPGDGRIEELMVPFEDPVLPGGNSRAGKDAETILLENGFKTRFEAGKMFGMNKAPVYEREFELSKVGDRQKLPRGRQIGGNFGDVDESFWRSVFIGGEAAAQQMKEDEEREKDEWTKKVVVDSLSVQIGGFVSRDKTIMADRTKDILRDDPRRKWLKHLRNRQSATGRDLSYAPAPFAIMGLGEYVPNAAANAMVRAREPEKFMTTVDFEAGKETAKTGQDFVRFINTDERVPKSQKILAKRSIPLMRNDEFTGPRWERPVSTTED